MQEAKNIFHIASMKALNYCTDDTDWFRNEITTVRL